MILLYIDPGSGTVLLQLVIAGIAGIISYSKIVRTYISKFIKSILGKK
jgi:hypothetical protein